MADTKERPILFSGEMVRAILEGRKTQTRRIVKFNDAGRLSLRGRNWHRDDPEAIKACPYGQPRDRLWVRETFSRTNPGGNDGVYFYKADGKFPDSVGGKDYTNVVWKPSIHMPRAASRILLEVTDVRVERLQDISGNDCFAEGVQVPVSQDRRPLLRLSGKLSPSKVSGKHFDEWALDDFARFEYAQLWESLNGKGSWEENPWVWVIEFKVVEVKG